MRSRSREAGARRGGRRPAARPAVRCALVLVLLGALASVSPASQPTRPSPDDLDALVEGGRVEALEVRLHGRDDVEALRALALAYANRAAAASDDADRESAIAMARERLNRWVAAVDRQSQGLEPPRAAVATAQVRLTYASAILSRWTARELDRRELLGERAGDEAALRERLAQATRLCDDALGRAAPLLAELRSGGAAAEERLLALGVYDDLRRIDREGRFQRAWAQLRLASLTPDATQREALLIAAGDAFGELLDSGLSGDPAARCALGRAMTLRLRGRFAAAGADFKRALDAASDPVLLGRIRYEHARSEFDAGHFEEGRLLIRPLLAIDESKLTPGERGVRFYVNLARLWEANSYLLEAASLARAGAAGDARDAIAARAGQIRERGLVRMNRLAAKGGEWSPIVRLYVRDVLTADTPLERCTPAELLFRARLASDDGEPERAIRILKTAAARDDAPAELRGEILFDLGRALATSGDEEAAIEALSGVLALPGAHPRSADALTLAVRLCAQVAEKTQRPEHYRRLAGKLLALLQRFPRHPQRAEAMWWLPVALQAAGDYAAAAEHFGNVPAASPHWEQAQFRRVECLRSAWLADRAGEVGPVAALRARRVADELRAYADAALRRAPGDEAGRLVRAWAGEALLQSAEILVSGDVEQYQAALDTLDGFEQRVAVAELVPRALALRIRALGGLRRFDQAAGVVDALLAAAAPDQVVPALARIAREMRDEVDRLAQRDAAQAAQRMAADAARVFERLASAAGSSSGAGDRIDAIRFGLAEMKLAAGDAAGAAEIAGELLASAPDRGEYALLLARALTAALPEQADRKDVLAAREAWLRLLSDANLKANQPDRYWEARLESLRLTLRLGAADDVRRAIEQMRIWDEDLGGPEWRAEFDELYEAARR